MASNVEGAIKLDCGQVDSLKNNLINQFKIDRDKAMFMLENLGTNGNGVDVQKLDDVNLLVGNLQKAIRDPNIQSLYGQVQKFKDISKQLTDSINLSHSILIKQAS